MNTCCSSVCRPLTKCPISNLRPQDSAGQKRVDNDRPVNDFPTDYLLLWTKMARPVFCLYFSCRHFPTVVLKKKEAICTPTLCLTRETKIPPVPLVFFWWWELPSCVFPVDGAICWKNEKRPQVADSARDSIDCPPFGWVSYRKLHFFSKCPPPEDSLSRPKGESLADEIKLPSH